MFTVLTMKKLRKRIMRRVKLILEQLDISDLIIEKMFLNISIRVYEIYYLLSKFVLKLSDRKLSNNFIQTTICFSFLRLKGSTVASLMLHQYFLHLNYMHHISDKLFKYD